MPQHKFIAIGEKFDVKKKTLSVTIQSGAEHIGTKTDLSPDEAQEYAEQYNAETHLADHTGVVNEFPLGFRSLNSARKEKAGERADIDEGEDAAAHTKAKPRKKKS